MLRKKFLYQHYGRTDTTYTQSRRNDSSQSEDSLDTNLQKTLYSVAYDSELVPTNNLPPSMVEPRDRAKAQDYIQGAYAAILAGDTNGFLRNIAMLRSITFEYDVDYAEAVLKWFGDFERGINSIRASMQGFSAQEGSYKLTELEYKVFAKAKELLELVEFSLSNVQGGNIVQQLLDGYKAGGSVTISKEGANQVMQFMTEMEVKLLPSDMKQEVLAAQLEATNKKRSSLYEATLPGMSRNSYAQ